MDIKLLLQIAGVLLGLLYLWLEYRADIRLWIVGLVMPLIHGALYYKSGLYADCSMQAGGAVRVARVAQEGPKNGRRADRP